MPLTPMLSTDVTPGSGLAAQYQTKFNSDLLERAIQLTVFDQFGQRESFPKNAGAKTMTFFRQTSAPTSRTNATTTAGVGGEVQTLTEGTLISSSGTIGYNTVLATMLQYGNVLEFSDIVGMTALFNALNGVKDRIAETAALHADDIVRNKIFGQGIPGTGVNGNIPGSESAGTAGFIRLYAQATSAAYSYANFNSAATTAANLTVNDMLRAFTRLKVNRAPMKNGRYYMICPPEVTFDLMNDAKWLNIGYYQDKSQIVKGEVGQLYGVRIVESTNPFIESSSGTEGNYNSAGNAYISFALGQSAFGTPIMAGQSPYSPSIQVVNTADKLDPLNQITAVGWKAYWCCTVLNSTWGAAIAAKSNYVG